MKTTFMESLLNLISPSGGLELGLDMALKGVLLLVVATLWVWGLRRSSAAVRHLVWCLAVTGLLLLPVLTLILPQWRLPVLPAWRLAHANNAARGSGNGPFESSLPPELALSERTVLDQQSSLAVSQGLGDVLPGTLDRTHDGLEAAFNPPAGNISWPEAFGCLWAIGVTLMLLPSLVGALALRRIRRQAKRVTSPDWLRQLQEAQETLRLRRRVTLFQSGQTTMPMTWGTWLPKLLLPVEADTWPVERRRMVLLHELAHIKRWDCLTQTLARVARALHWFNPLAWLVVGRMRFEREQSCDDLVLTTGAKASEYADELLQLATRLRGLRFATGAAVAMARRATLEERLLAILDHSRCRRSVTRWTLALAVGLMVLTVTPLAILHAAAPATEKDTNTTAPPEGLSAAELLPKPLPQRIQKFFAAKAQQAHELAAAEHHKLPEEIEDYFAAAARGDWSGLTNIYAQLRHQAPGVWRHQ